MDHRVTSQNYRIFLVGGAIRDKLLGRPSRDRDFVVVGATPELLLRSGFTQSTERFPVFLHPDTKEEYALARVEQKINKGCRGFTFDVSPHITLEQDLSRRDLTINAMAIEANTDDALGTEMISMDNIRGIIDPFGGLRDIQTKVLRHVSPAFVEDPVRILRLASFSARLSALGFTVAPETMELVKSMALSDEIATLSSERIWMYFEQALGTPNPQSFVQVLRQTNLLKVLIPGHGGWRDEMEKQHPTEVALRKSAGLSSNVAIRFSAFLCSATDETLADFDEQRNGYLLLAQRICDHLKVPKGYRELALGVCKFHNLCHRAKQLTAQEVMTMFTDLGAFKHKRLFREFLIACEATWVDQRDYPQAPYLESLLSAATSLDTSRLIHEIQSRHPSDVSGQKIGAEIYQARHRLIQHQIHALDHNETAPGV